MSRSERHYAHDPIAQAQAALANYPELDGWLIYDFRRQNPHAVKVLQLPEGAFITRRFFVWIPRNGPAVLLHHHIEAGTWQHITTTWGSQAGLEHRAFGSHVELAEQLGYLLAGKQLAMEYSPLSSVPHVGRVDAGTHELVQASGARVVSSADLLQAFLLWSQEDLAAHQRAVKVLVAAKDAAFALIDQRLKANDPVDEYQVQALIMSRIQEAGMRAGHPINVSFGSNAADSHYEPSAIRYATLQEGQCVLIDLWAQEKGYPFADITWVGYAGQPSQLYLEAWQAVKSARNAALSLMQQRFAAEGWGILQGWELDRAAREAMRQCQGGERWLKHFVHRSGHDLGVQIHGAGANLDDYETHDTRALQQGLAVTVEPGTYPAALGFGIRSEVDVYLSETGPQVTTPLQAEPLILGE